jgi:zinc protease
MSDVRKLLAVALLTFIVLTRPAAAVEVKQITSPGGISIWFVEDHRLPILSLSFAFQGGISLDPPGKAGLAHFVSGMLDEGAGPRDSETFQAVLADNSIALDFSAGRDSFDGAMRTLTSHTDLAAELLHDALTAPHLNPPDADRIRDDIEAEIKRNMADPNWVAQRTFNGRVFAGHPYGEPGHGSLDSIAAITPDDLKAYIQAHFGRDQLLVTATGDIDAAALGAVVDRIFGDLPAKAAPFTIPEATLHEAGQTIVVEKPIPESVLLLGGPGPKRDDPDWYAAEIMNYALGGGGFNSRLMEEVRAKRGLTYGVGSSLVPFQHAGLIEISGSTKNEDAAQALKLIDSEVARFATGGITDAELKDAKTYLTGSVPLELTSTMRISSALLSLRLDHLPPDFFDEIAAKLNAVTKADVARAAKRFLQPAQFTTVVLGQPAGIASSP